MRSLALALVLLLAQATAALAHASLVQADPADGAVMPRPPAALTLTFNEPVSPLVIRLIGPGGEAIALAGINAENATIAIPLPTGLAKGTHVLSWRVVSADGHPVGGAVLFSIGAPSGAPSAGPPGDPSVQVAIWMAKLVIYLGLLVGVGGAFFYAWLGGPGGRRAGPILVAALAAGLIAVPVSVGLQGLDALELPLSGLLDRHAFAEGLATAYGSSAIVASFALLLALVSLGAGSEAAARALALGGMCAVGLALAASGHASTAEPRLASRAALFLHGLCVAFWIGALLPLLAGVRGTAGAGDELARFSRAIPWVLAALLASGAWLMLVQLDGPDALWRTTYGRLLAGKLALVILLLGLGAANRFLLVPQLSAGRTARRWLAVSVGCELALAVVILMLVALWRFTPPPRALAVVAPISLHLHGERVMAEIVIARGGEQGGQARLHVLDAEFRPLAVKEVVLVLANPAAGIEPLRRLATRTDEHAWRVDGVRIPLAGRWLLRVEVLVSDFEKLSVEDTAVLPRLP